MAVASSSVRERLQVVRTHVSEVQKCFSHNKTITVIAVSKKQPPEAITEAYKCGQMDFGENYVQELAEKATLQGLNG